MWFFRIFTSLLAILNIGLYGLFISLLVVLKNTPAGTGWTMEGHEICEVMIVQAIIIALSWLVFLLSLILMACVLANKQKFCSLHRSVLICVCVLGMCMMPFFGFEGWLVSPDWPDAHSTVLSTRIQLQDNIEPDDSSEETSLP